MTEAELERMKRVNLEDYARQRSRNFDTPIEQERDVAARQFADLLKDGPATEGHLLWSVVRDGGEVVGNLWVHVDAAERRAFIYDVTIGEQHRGQGYGRHTLELLEEEMRPRGVTRIGLNVFGDNAVARHLYEKQGYRTTSTHLEKKL
jgi:ribosomal protein S18 acetylase RimI-like enzyme